MKLFIVFDSKGSGRVVGVFDTRERAEEVVEINPNYYSIHVSSLNEIDESALDWTQTEEEGKRLRALRDRLLGK